MVPDVIDLTELVIGERLDGIFYSTFIVFTKLGVALSLFSSSFILGLVGFESSAHQTISELEDSYQPPEVHFEI
jgi:Na+/melibiose symporter-like transporter